MQKKFLMLIPLVLAGILHLANPVGYPDIFFDEGIYMRRAMHTLDTGNPQESYLYDHPYFGQIVLAGALKLANYPPDVTTDPQSLQNLYMIPRVFMGLVAIASTFLVFQIAKERFGKNIAFVSAMLFAVMPYTWILNRILLDSILLPFLLASILLAIHFGKQQGKIWLAPLSGVMLGLAIFTKIPAFVFIPFLVWLIYQKRRKFSDLVIFIIPVLLIPMMWPANAIMFDQFDLWIKDVLWQTQRSNSIFEIIGYFLMADPVLFVIGMAGMVYSAITKNKFVLLWFVPFVAFLSLIGFKQYFHWIPILPVLCIGAAIWLVDIPKRVRYAKSKTIHSIIVASIIAFGFACSAILITNDVSSGQFEALSFVLQNNDPQSTILASPVYTWILSDVFGLQNVPVDYAMVLFEPVNTQKVMVVADFHFMLDQNRGEPLQMAYNTTESAMYFEGRVGNYDSRVYPYTNMRLNLEGGPIDIRTGNWNQ